MHYIKKGDKNMKKEKQLYNIYYSLMCGQLKQMTEQINEYGLYDFFADFNEYLIEIGIQHDEFINCVISYHRIMNK